MKSKKCTKCNKIKHLDEFHKAKLGKFGRTAVCKDCKKIYNDEHKERRSFLNKERYKRDSERIKKNVNTYRQKNHEEIKAKKRKYWHKNREKLLKKKSIYNKQTRKHRNAHTKARKKCDPNFKLAINIRGRLNRAIKNNYKSGSSISDLGCTISELKQYIQTKFKQGMTWENWSKNGWHLDHIQPLSSFDLTDRDQFLKAVHYTNLQPLWAEEHKQKTKKDLITLKLKT
jgi:hypothetical protein